jgi:DNA-binding response OmpR family regulator
MPVDATSHRPLRIALVEDDDALRDRVLVPGLRDYGFDVHAMRDAAALDALMAETPVDIVVLDVGLPGEDGFAVTQRLRAVSGVGVVLLTGRGEVADRIRGLSEGADAYLAKPVVLGELAATLHSLARRLRASPTLTVAADWRLDSDDWCLRSPKGASIALSRPERDVLRQLFATRGHQVPRETLIADLTDNAFDFDPHRLEMLIHRLRTKVLDGSGERLPLRAVRGAGYVMLP